jgi:hypothetical protein
MGNSDRFGARSAARALSVALLFSACESESAHPNGAQAGATSRATDAAATNDAAAAGEAERWVGEVEDSDVRVGIVADATHARLFFCGGASSYASATRWFALDVTDSALQFADDTWQLDARIDSERVTGQVTRDDGVARAFSAELVEPDTLAGVYEGQADCGRLGLIVLQPNKRSTPQAQGACVGAGHAPEQVNPILPVAQDNGEIPVEAPGAQAATVGLHALQLPPP